MNPAIAQLFIIILYLIFAAVIVRSLISWFPVRPDNPYVLLLNRVTDPLLEPIRRFVPRMGMIDLSGLILLILLQIMISVVGRAANS